MSFSGGNKTGPGDLRSAVPAGSETLAEQSCRGRTVLLRPIIVVRMDVGDQPATRDLGLFREGRMSDAVRLQIGRSAEP